MAISFKGALKYKNFSGISRRMTIEKPLSSPKHFYFPKGLTPLVKVGDTVLKGQKIADAESFDVNPIISGCSGKVTIADENTIAVDNDMLYTTHNYAALETDYNNLTSRELFWLIREGGVYEARLKRPLHLILAGKRVPDCIILCAFHSDPYVSSPQAAAMGKSEKIVKGLELCLKLSGAKKAYVAVENNTRGTFADFKAALRFHPTISPVILKARYPQHKEEFLINAVAGKKNNNALILTPETLVNMMSVLETGRRITEKIVTVSGDGGKGQNYSVPIGSTVASVIESGGYSLPSYIISGGCIDGDRITDLDLPITPDTTAIVSFNEAKNIPEYRSELL